MKLSFLHLSDLHYLDGWEEEIGIVQQRFFADVTQELKGLDAYLLFSGDLLKAGESAPLYTSFCSKYTQVFDGLGLKKERRIVVPGNHDVSQLVACTRRATLPLALQSCTSEAEFNDALFPELEEHFVAKFSEFSKFTDDFTATPFTPDRNSGFGVALSNEIAIYCLNTALCSFGGARNAKGEAIEDKGLLGVNTRSLHAWLQATDAKFKILLTHHPLSWLSSWAASELKTVILSQFSLVLSGHEHTQSSYALNLGDGSAVFVEAPALFSRKRDDLGYAIISVDAQEMRVSVKYRQWEPKFQKFVLGVSFAGNDTGEIEFRLSKPALQDPPVCCNKSQAVTSRLHANLKGALSCYHHTNPCWVLRQLSDTPETNHRDHPVIYTEADISSARYDCILRAPAEFGLTCLGRKIALHAWEGGSANYFAFIDASETGAHESAVRESVAHSIIDDQAGDFNLGGIIIDNWCHGDNRHTRIANNAKKEFPDARIIMLNRIELHEVQQTELPEKLKFTPQTLFLWTLDRETLYHLVSDFVENTDLPDADVVAERVISDLDSLCIPRTPLHCLNLLKSNEYLFDESPVNRTEVLDRVLRVLFCRFEGIPKYSTRPDLKDCEFALGGFCEILMRRQQYQFSKEEFLESIRNYCREKSISLESNLLFEFLDQERILVRRDGKYGFRYTYWLHFFAAHRMGHSSEFFDYVMTNRRYSHCPELIEFYSGIDRHRGDLIERLTNDLRYLNDHVTERTGIREDFDPYPELKWNATEEEVQHLEAEVDKTAGESLLPKVVRHEIADRGYDRAAVYDQQIRVFLNDVSFGHTVNTMEAACRALRNSEHVNREIKLRLLEQILRTWKKIVQLAVFLVPKMMKEGKAGFDGFGFYLLDWNAEQPMSGRQFMNILLNIPSCIVRHAHRALFSKKNGPLFIEFGKETKDPMYSLMCNHVLLLQRPPGWKAAVDAYVDGLNRNDFYLNDILRVAGSDRREAFILVEESDHLRSVMARVMIKHNMGRSKPGAKMLFEVAESIRAKENI